MSLQAADDAAGAALSAVACAGSAMLSWQASASVFEVQ
jgi:hypothetical protein